MPFLAGGFAGGERVREPAREGGGVGLGRVLVFVAAVLLTGVAPFLGGLLAVGRGAGFEGRVVLLAAAGFLAGSVGRRSAAFDRFEGVEDLWALKPSLGAAGLLEDGLAAALFDDGPGVGLAG